MLYLCLKESGLIHMSFDGFLMHRVIEKLNNELVSGKVNRIYQVSKYELLFYIRAYRKNVRK